MTPNWKKIAKIYDNKEWAFSSAFAWKKTVKENPSAFNLQAYAEQLRLSGNYSEAKRIIEQIVFEEIPPKYRFVYYTRKGTIHQNEGEIDAAIECYEKAVALEPEEAWPYIFLGAVLSMKSRLDEAEYMMKKALTKDDGNIDEINYNLSLIFARRGDFKAAIEAMEKCLSIDPNYSNAATWLADLKNMKRQHQE